MQALLGTLADPRESVRLATVEALGTLGDAQALAPVTRLLHDAAWRVSLAAQDTVVKLRRTTHEDDLQA